MSVANNASAHTTGGAASSQSMAGSAAIPALWHTVERGGDRTVSAEANVLVDALVGQNVIVILCGPPGVGKTTLATHLQDRLAERGHDFSLLHSDDFSRRTYERMYERVVGTDEDWILDGTFYQREWQERFRTLGDVRFVWVTASVETCLERNLTRSDRISETGVHVVHAEFADPSADLVIDTDALTVEEAVDRLEAAVCEWLDEVDGSA